LTSGLPNPKHQLLPDLSFYLWRFNFNNRDQVLATAKAKNTGLLPTMVLVDYYQSDYLLLAGKIVSVEARHASAIKPNS
jgi:UDP-2,3-diacylglucosamine pyrophosphatase LpxH